MDDAKLKTELDDDPLGRAYSSNNLLAARRINIADRAISAPVRTATEMSSAVVGSEWDALSEAVQSNALLALTSENLDPAFVMIVLTKAFGSGSETVAALSTARTVLVSRAQELGILEREKFVKDSDVERVRTR